MFPSTYQDKKFSKHIPKKFLNWYWGAYITWCVYTRLIGWTSLQR